MTERIDIQGDWQRVSVKYAVVDAVTTIVWGAIIALGVSIPMYFAFGMELLPALPIGLGLLVFFIVIAVFSFLRVRTIGYALREDDLLVRRGMLFRRFVAVPYGRMQIVDVTQGPLERMFDLKTLKFVTAAASSAVTIPGLIGDRADALRDTFVAVAESRRAGL